jgi:uncharacterized protein
MPEPTAMEPPGRPPSPCINVCSLDARGFCVGCLRSAEEIGRWLSMSAAEQWRLLAQLDARRKEREVPDDGCSGTNQGGAVR